MSSFAFIRPRLSEWRGWLPLAALPTLMFIALLALGGDRGYFYRDGAGHDWNTLKTLAVAENMSPENGFLLALRTWRDDDGELRHEFYGRFPVGCYVLIRLATLPFGDDLAATLLAARVLMLLMFCGAALFACLAISRITGSRRIAIAAALLAFSGYYAVYYADEVSNESVMDLFGAALTFHGMVAFAQEGRFRQLAVKTCAALLLGWHVYALLLPFIALGFGGDAVALARSALASGGGAGAVARARSAIIPLARSRYAALAAVAILFGSALLTFNLVNEHLSFEGGEERTLLDAPSLRSAASRFGLIDNYEHRPELAWGNFIRRQFYRVGAASAPYAVVRAVGYDFPAHEPLNAPLAPAVLGAAATIAALAALALARRYRISLAAAVLFGFCWAIPLRHSVFEPIHSHESLPYLFLALSLFALALSGARRLLGARGGERLALAVGAAAACVFTLSVFHAGQRDRDDAEAEMDKAIMADFSAIRARTRGENVAVFRRYDHELERMRTRYFMAGSHWVEDADACDPRRWDFAVSRYRDEGLNLLTPENRFAFLYEDTAPLELCRAERRRIESSEPAARSEFDVYLQDGALSYLKAPCEPSDYEAPLFAYAYPVDANGSRPAWRKWETFARLGAAFDGACLMTLRPPDYPTSAIWTGQGAGDGETEWDVLITPPLDAEALALYEKAYQAVKSSGEPAARAGGFDLYLYDGALSYLKAPCGEDDTRGRFFLSVHPADAADLPAARREIGHDSLNFTFAPPDGAVFNGKCMATRRLPDYEITKIETGQWIPGGERLWDVELVVGD